MGLASTPVPLSLPHSPLGDPRLGGGSTYRPCALRLRGVIAAAFRGHRQTSGPVGRRWNQTRWGPGRAEPRVLQGQVAAGGTQLEGRGPGQTDRVGRKVSGQVREGNVRSESRGGGQRAAGLETQAPEQPAGRPPPLPLPAVCPWASDTASLCSVLSPVHSPPGGPIIVACVSPAAGRAGLWSKKGSRVEVWRREGGERRGHRPRGRSTSSGQNARGGGWGAAAWHPLQLYPLPDM